MKVVGSGLGHDIDRSAARRAQISLVVASVDLEFLHRVLAQRRAHSTCIVACLAAIYRDAVATAIASVEGKAALRGLLHAKVLVTSQARGVGYAGRQQR